VQLETGAHRSSIGVCEEALNVAEVPCPEPFGDQELEALPDELCTRVPEHALGARVDQRDRSAVVYHDHGIWSGVEERAESGARRALFR